MSFEVSSTDCSVCFRNRNELRSDDESSEERQFDVVMLVCDQPKAHVIGKAASFGVETVVLES